MLKALDEAHISVEYLYSFVWDQDENALILFRVEDIEGALKKFEESHIKLLSAKDIEQKK